LTIFAILIRIWPELTKVECCVDQLTCWLPYERLTRERVLSFQTRVSSSMVSPSFGCDEVQCGCHGNACGCRFRRDECWPVAIPMVTDEKVRRGGCSDVDEMVQICGLLWHDDGVRRFKLLVREGCCRRCCDGANSRYKDDGRWLDLQRWRMKVLLLQWWCRCRCGGRAMVAVEMVAAAKMYAVQMRAAVI